MNNEMDQNDDNKRIGVLMMFGPTSGSNNNSGNI